jgi:hypothetical protein
LDPPFCFRAVLGYLPYAQTPPGGRAKSKPKPFRFMRESMGEKRDFSGWTRNHHKRKKRRNHYELYALSLAPRFFIAVVQIHRTASIGLLLLYKFLLVGFARTGAPIC